MNEDMLARLNNWKHLVWQCPLDETCGEWLYLNYCVNSGGGGGGGVLLFFVLKLQSIALF